MGDFSALKAELSGMLQASSREFKKIGSCRASAERIDSYAALLRRILSKSSLCYIGGSLSFFDGKAYVSINQKELVVTMGNLLFSMGVGASDIRRLGDMPTLVVHEKSFEPDRNKICFSNCVYDVSRGETMPFSRDCFTDYRLPYPYYSDASCPLWEAFLREVVPDVGERACLQEFFGMCYLDRSVISVEKFAVFIGGGSNGKSVVFDVMKNVIGQDRVSYLSPDQLMDSRQVVGVIGKRLNFAPDIRKGAAFDSALKALSSGQDIQGWKLYSGNVVVRCPPLVFAMNEMPRFRDMTFAFFRRVLLFSFDVTVPQERQDRSLASRIVREEAPGVFGWVMAGTERLRANGGEFTYSQKMYEDLERLKSRVKCEETPVLSYLESEGYSVDPCWIGQLPVKVKAGEIYRGMEGRLSKDAITRELTSLGVRRDRGTEVRYFLYKK